MAPGRVESNETLDRIKDRMSRSTTRTVGPLSLTVCSPPSRRVAALRPRCAGLTALTPAARTVDRPLLPDSAGRGFLYRLMLTPNTPNLVAGRLHAQREILVRGRRDLSDRGEGLGEPGSPAPTRVVTGVIPIQAAMPTNSRTARLRLCTAHRAKLRCPSGTGGSRLQLTRSEVTLAKKGGHALTC